MPWQARTSADRRYVEILYSGRVTPDELQAAFDRAMELSRSLERPWFFADCTGLTENPPLSGLYFLADQFATVAFEQRVREALVLPARPESADSVTFWETTCANRGLDVKVFAEREPALDWLLREQPSSRP